LAGVEVKTPAQCTRCSENRRKDDDTHDCPLKRHYHASPTGEKPKVNAPHFAVDLVTILQQ
jgi:hypothetical protein